MIHLSEKLNILVTPKTKDKFKSDSTAYDVVKKKPLLSIKPGDYLIVGLEKDRINILKAKSIVKYTNHITIYYPCDGDEAFQEIYINELESKYSYIDPDFDLFISTDLLEVKKHYGISYLPEPEMIYECEGGPAGSGMFATPGNTMGMGNPDAGEAGLGAARKRKKKKMNKLSD